MIPSLYTKFLIFIFFFVLLSIRLRKKMTNIVNYQERLLFTELLQYSGVGNKIFYLLESVMISYQTNRCLLCKHAVIFS